MVYGVCSNHQTRVCSRCTHTHFSADGRTDVTCGESRQDNTIQGCAHKKKKKKHLDYSSSAVQNHRRQGREGGRVGEEVEVIGEEAAASFWLCQYGATVNSEQVFVFVLQEKKKKRCVVAFTQAREAQRLASTPKKPLVRSWESGRGGVCGGWRKVKLEHQAP